MSKGKYYPCSGSLELETKNDNDGINEGVVFGRDEEEW
jgi:hypothetical protein